MIASSRGKSMRSFHAQIGSVLAAALLAIGCASVIRASSEPIAALLVWVINLLLDRLHRDLYSLASPPLAWAFLAASLVIGLIVIALGLRLGFWLHRKGAS